MKTKIISASELGINCWSTLRFFDKCFECPRYERCKYPEKVLCVDFEFLRNEKPGQRIK